jgi:hypothetical protein
MGGMEDERWKKPGGEIKLGKSETFLTFLSEAFYEN